PVLRGGVRRAEDRRRHPRRRPPLRHRTGGAGDRGGRRVRGVDPDRLRQELDLGGVGGGGGGAAHRGGTGVAPHRRWVGVFRHRRGGRRRGHPAVGALYPNLVPSTANPEWSLTIYNASST